MILPILLYLGLLLSLIYPLFVCFHVLFELLSRGFTGLTLLYSVSSSGYLVLDKPLDRESLDYYTLVVTASDGHPGGVRKRLVLTRVVSLFPQWN